MPTFEDLLSDPVLQFDLGDELLPHILVFGPPESSRPWLFDAAITTTAAPYGDEGQRPRPSGGANA